jgi:hypothetical protein
MMEGENERSREWENGRRQWQKDRMRRGGVPLLSFFHSLILSLALLLPNVLE